MNETTFRYLLPGITFWLPTFGFLTLTGIVADSTLLRLVGVVLATAVPFGFALYNVFRVRWQLIPGAGNYETKMFADLVRSNLRISLSPKQESALVGFQELDTDLGVRQLSGAEFLQVFHFFDWRGDRTLVAGDLDDLRVEPIADHFLFQESSFSYARSISSARYGLDVSGNALLWGIAVLPAFATFSVTLHGGYPTPGGFIAAAVLFLPVFAGIAWALMCRRKMAAAEYDTRLFLSALFQSDAKKTSIREIAKAIPVALRAQVLDLPDGPNHIAAFDFDLTMIHGDIGESVLRIIEAGRWQEYETLMKDEHTEEAYRMAAEIAGSHKGLDDVVDGITKRKEVAPSATMVAIVHVLRLKGWECVVISGSHVRCVARLAWRMFGIPPTHVLGIETDHEGRIVGPTVFGEAKVELFRAWAKGRAANATAADDAEDSQPHFVASDSPLDFPLMRICAPGGLIIGVDRGKDLSPMIEELRQRTDPPRMVIVDPKKLD